MIKRRHCLIKLRHGLIKQRHCFMFLFHHQHKISQNPNGSTRFRVGMSFIGRRRCGIPAAHGSCMHTVSQRCFCPARKPDLLQLPTQILVVPQKKERLFGYMNFYSYFCNVISRIPEVFGTDRQLNRKNYNNYNR